MSVKYAEIISFFNENRRLVLLRTIEFFQDGLQSVWLLTSYNRFLVDHKDCLNSSPILTYTVIFILVVAFIHLIKFFFKILMIIFFILLKIAQVPDFSLDDLIGLNLDLNERRN